MNIELLKELSGNECKVYLYLILRSGERKLIHGIEREQIQEGCNTSYATTYNALKRLKELKLIEYNGKKKFVKILATS